MMQETFERELTRRAEDIPVVPLSFQDVRGRARQIRRRRTALAAGIAAVVAAVVLVPVALTGGDGDRTPEPAPAPDTPGASVLHDGVVTLPGGRAVPVDVDSADVTDFGVLTDGRIVLALQRPYAVRVYAADGSLDATYDVQMNAITMSPRDDAVAWVAKDFTVRVLSSGSADPVTLPGIPMEGESVGSIDAVLDADHLLVGDWTTTTGELTPDGFRELTTVEPLRVTDVNAEASLWAVEYDDNADGQYDCSGLYDPEGKAMTARNCETSALRFSPDGKHLLGMRGDNNMVGLAATYDLELEDVGGFEAPGDGDVVSRAAWADAEQVLVARTNWETSAWWLERVGLDWTRPTVVVPEGPGRNPEFVAEFVLSQ